MKYPETLCCNGSLRRELFFLTNFEERTERMYQLAASILMKQSSSSLRGHIN